MNEEIKLSMINSRGRIVFIDKRQLKEAIEQGLRLFPNPKEKYYPELDSELNKQAKDIPIPGIENDPEKLVVIVL